MTMTRTRQQSRIVGCRVPVDAVERFDALAKKTCRTRSDLLRDLIQSAEERTPVADIHLRPGTRECAP